MDIFRRCGDIKEIFLGFLGDLEIVTTYLNHVNKIITYVETLLWQYYTEIHYRSKLWGWFESLLLTEAAFIWLKIQ